MNKLQLQPIQTAPRNCGNTLILIKTTIHRRLVPGFWGSISGAWLINGETYSDESIEGWAPIPEFELPPKPKTVIEEVEEINAGIYHCPEAMRKDVLDILRKRKGEVIK